MSDLLDGEMDDATWSRHVAICEALGLIGSPAELALPSLFRHAERYPRFELNVMAIGRIGGPGVVRRLMEWTYWQGGEHDRKRTDATCGAISRLGDAGIRELLEIADSDSDDPHDRARAILNLMDNTSYPREQIVSLIGRELDRSNMIQCVEALGERLVVLGGEYPATVVDDVTSRLTAGSGGSPELIHVLARLGELGVPGLKEALKLGVRKPEIVEALVGIGGTGLEAVYELLASSNDYQALLSATDAIPARGERSFAALADLIQRKHGDSSQDEAVRLNAIAKLKSFTDQRESIDAFLSCLATG
jgi:hypothetical protein